MSRRPVRYLVCDKPRCRARFVHGGWSSKHLVPLSTLRRAARKQGWKHSKEGRDYCPFHHPWPGFSAWVTAGAGAR